MNKNNGLNRMNYYSYELKTKDRTDKSNEIQRLIQELIPLEEENHVKILDFLVIFKKNDQGVSCFIF